VAKGHIKDCANPIGFWWAQSLFLELAVLLCRAQVKLVLLTLPKVEENIFVANELQSMGFQG
jgi:hypothetical protein